MIVFNVTFGKEVNWQEICSSHIPRLVSMDPGMDDGDMKVAHLVSVFFQWQEDHPDEAKEVSFEFLDATETTLDFKAKGMLFQLLLPTMLLQKDVASDEIFIAMNLDNLAPSGLMVAVNEKLERVSIGPRALEQGLDVIAKALISYEGKRKRQSQSKAVQLQGGMTLLHDFTFAIERTIGQANTVEFQEEKSSNYDSDVDLSSDDLEGHFTGFLHGVIREASERCEAARHRSVESFLFVPANPSFLVSAELKSVDDILQFCKVSAVNKCQVRIEAEVVGFVNDVKIAASLGLPCSKTIQIFLEFDEQLWIERGSRQPLTLNRVAVGLEMTRCAKFLPDVETSWADPTGVASDDEFEAECKKFHGRQRTVAYGSNALIPELIKAFFDFSSGKTAVNPRPRPWKNHYMDTALESYTLMENPLIGLISFIGSQMTALPSWCAVCWSLLPTSVWRLRTCQNDLCLYDFEELGLGATIHHEIQESPEVVELELSLACAAASSDRDVFEPFPSFFLTESALRGRSGWFSETSSRQVTRKPQVETSLGFNSSLDPVVFIPGPAASPAAVLKGFTGGGLTSISERYSDGKEIKNKQLTLLLEILQTVPSIADLKQSAGDENSLKKKLSKAAFSMWRKKDPPARAEQCQMWLSYELLRFILSTNRLSLRIMKEEEEFKISAKPRFQFVVIHDSPEKEAIFNERRKQKGSFFAFHGSGSGNWYSILRNGLRPMSNTKFMSSGAVYGQGIYLADNFGLSYSYTRNVSHVSWKNGSLQEGMFVIAICEVITGVTTEQNALGLRPNNHIIIVPPGEEDSVSVRYLLVMDSIYNHSNSGLSIKGRMLQESSLSEHSIDLREKYERLRNEDQALQQMILLDRRKAAFWRMKGEVSCPKTDTERVDKKLPTPATTEPSCYASPGSEGESPTSSYTAPPISKRLKENYTLASLTTTDALAITTQLTLLQNETGQSKPGASSSSGARTESATATQATAAKLATVQNEIGRAERGTSSSSGARTESATATQAITKELKNIEKEIRKAKQGTSSSGGLGSQPFLANITLDIPNETNIYIWHVTLSQNLFTSYANLYKDLQKLATLKKQPESSVILEVTFPGMYPFEPPFVRVVTPKFLFHTGHVTIGGSICMELLTTTGWLPSFSFESVLVQIVNAFIEGEGRIDMRAIGKEYSKEEAQRAFTRVADQHGWTVNKSKQVPFSTEVLGKDVSFSSLELTRGRRPHP